jgi:hypothetical protein
MSLYLLGRKRAFGLKEYDMMEAATEISTRLKRLTAPNKTSKPTLLMEAITVSKNSIMDDTMLAVY